MLSDPTAAGQPLGPVLLTGPQIILWCPTFRPRFPTGTPGAFQESEAGRENTTAFIKLIKERVRLETTSSAPWQWRRLVFTWKGLLTDVATLPVTSYTRTQTNSLDANRFDVMRVTAPLTGPQQGVLLSLLLRGAAGEDWFDPITAYKDTLNVKFLYDRTRTINSANEEGCIREYTDKHWILKNLKYNDVEVGTVSAVNPVTGVGVAGFSTQSRVGMGDVYIADIFRPINASGSTQINFLPECQIYWHEK